MNTSIGYHTLSFFQRVNGEEFSSLTKDFIAYADKNKDTIKRFPKNNGKEWEYIYKENKGIRWQLQSFEINGYTIQGVRVIINPQALINENYITAANKSNLEDVEKIYNREAAKISRILSKFGSCSLSRLDPCMNIDLKELGFPCTPEQMMTLIKQGNIPKHYKEREKYDKNQHRKIKDKNSFYLESKSTVINYYWKYPKQGENHPNFTFRESSRNVIRLEVQCKYVTLYVLSKDKRQESKYYVDHDKLSTYELYQSIMDGDFNPSIPIDIMLSDDISEEIVKKYVYKILRKGDYFTLDGARSFVKSFNFRREKEARLLYALEMVNAYHGIANAKLNLHDSDLDDFNRSLRDLDSIFLNPVTIPRRWGIKYIPNLLNAFYNYIDPYPRYLMTATECLRKKHLDEFLKKME